MKNVNLIVRIDPKLAAALRARKEATDVPTSTFVRKAIQRALEQPRVAEQ